MPDLKTIQGAIRARLAEVEKLIDPPRIEERRLTQVLAGCDDPEMQTTQHLN